MFEIEHVVSTQNEVGESPRWDAEAQAVPVTAQNQVLIVAILPFIHFGARPNSAPLSHTFHHPHQKRPLYLSYSCLLI